MTYQCPSCGAREAAAQATCPRCGEDLRLLHLLAAFPDAWFNEALRQWDEGHPTRALELAAASCVANPSDASAWRLLARLWARLGQPEAAGAALGRARESEPGNADLAPLAKAIGALAEDVATGDGRSFTARRRRLRRRRRRGRRPVGKQGD